MTCNFHVGQKVVCVGDNVGRPPIGSVLLSSVILPVKNRVYTVRAIGRGVVGGMMCLRLHEIDDQIITAIIDGEVWEADVMFGAVDFRPLVTRKADISIFKAMLNPSKVEERV